MALALDPTRAVSRYALSVCLLGQGQYLEGFKLFESRHQVSELKNQKPNLPFPEWDGSSVVGKKITIWPEQGFGDQIQFARFAPILKSMGAEVTLICSPALVTLFAQFEVNVVPASGSVEFPDPDGWVMCASIPGRMGLTVDNLPNAPYLKSRQHSRTTPFRIGIATKGNPNHTNDQYRSLSARDANRLANLPAEMIDLHPEKSGSKDFNDTLEIISDIDLIISVDTSVAHLAGAMGKECWLLVPSHNTDWRWLEDRNDSPWYPSMKLYRQKVPGSWIEVIDDIRRDILSESSRVSI